MSNENNQVTLKGQVADRITYSHSVYNESFYKFTMSVPRLSGTCDYIPVIASERMIFENVLTPGTQIMVTGQFRSYNNYWHEEEGKLKLLVFCKNIVLIDDLLMQNPNEIYLDGFVCKPPIYRATPFGREITDLLIAVNRSYNKSDYLPVIAWGKNARDSSTLSVGTHLKIYGRVQSREYQKRIKEDIITKTAYEISVTRFEVVDTE